MEEQAKWALFTVDDETEKVWNEVTEWWDKVSIYVPGILTTTYLLDCYVQLLFNHLKDLAKENKRSGITPGRVTIEYLIGP